MIVSYLSQSKSRRKPEELLDHDWLKRIELVEITIQVKLRVEIAT